MWYKCKCLEQGKLYVSVVNQTYVPYFTNCMTTNFESQEKNHYTSKLTFTFSGSFCGHRSTDYVSLRKTKEIKDRKQNNSKLRLIPSYQTIQNFTGPAERPHFLQKCFFCSSALNLGKTKTMKLTNKDSKWFPKGLYSNLQLLLGKISIPLYFPPLLTLYATLYTHIGKSQCSFVQISLTLIRR